mmetsp:Transcript_33261/g.78369  ORF Transcript_33261/g.78369 Transcript_33261/m.78369 type:complete len:206 (-) Transcript_33261:566-1183(-)
MGVARGHVLALRHRLGSQNRPGVDCNAGRAAVARLPLRRDLGGQAEHQVPQRKRLQAGSADLRRDRGAVRGRAEAALESDRDGRHVEHGREPRHPRRPQRACRASAHQRLERAAAPVPRVLRRLRAALLDQPQDREVLQEDSAGDEGQRRRRRGSVDPRGYQGGRRAIPAGAERGRLCLCHGQRSRQSQVARGRRLAAAGSACRA